MLIRVASKKKEAASSQIPDMAKSLKTVKLFKQWSLKKT